MSRGINKVIIIGNVGNDPEIKHTSDGKTIANFSIATSESWKDKQTGQAQEKTEWHRISAFNRLAEIIGEFVKKGAKIYVEGKLETRKWTDKNGEDRYTTSVVANEMQMLDRREDRTQAAPQQQAPQQGFHRVADGGGSGGAQELRHPSGAVDNSYSQRSHGGSGEPQDPRHSIGAADNSRSQAPAADMDSFDSDMPF